MVRAPDFSQQPGYVPPSHRSVESSDEREHSREHLVGVIWIKNVVFVFQILAMLLWILDIGVQFGADPLTWRILIASVAAQSLFMFIFGAVIKRPGLSAYGVFSFALVLFFLPYVDLSAWLGHTGILITLGLGLLIVSRTDTLPKKTDRLFWRFLFVLGMYAVSFLIFWNITALMSSTIYAFEEEDTEALTQEILQLRELEQREVVVTSASNLSGRFFFADLGPFQGQYVFDEHGKPVTLPDGSMRCLRPYAFTPFAREGSNWLCRVFATHWIFFYDYQSSLGPES